MVLLVLAYPKNALGKELIYTRHGHLCLEDDSFWDMWHPTISNMHNKNELDITKIVCWKRKLKQTEKHK